MVSELFTELFWRLSVVLAEFLLLSTWPATVGVRLLIALLQRLLAAADGETA